MASGNIFSTIDPTILQMDANNRARDRMNQAAVLQGYLDAGASGRLPGQPWSAKAIRRADREAKKMRPMTIKRIDGSTETRIRGQLVEKTDRKGRTVFSALSGADPAAIGKVFGINMVSAFGNGNQVQRAGGIKNPVPAQQPAQQQPAQQQPAQQQPVQQAKNQTVPSKPEKSDVQTPTTVQSAPQRSTAEIAQAMKKTGAYNDNGTWRTQTGQKIGDYESASAYLDTKKQLNGTGAYYDNGVWRTKTGSRINDTEQYAAVSAATKGTGAYYDAGVWRTNTGARLDIQSLDLNKNTAAPTAVAKNVSPEPAKAEPTVEIAAADKPEGPVEAATQSDSRVTSKDEEMKAAMYGGRTRDVFTKGARA